MTKTTGSCYAEHKTTYGKKILSVFLSVLMLIGCFGSVFSVFAEDTIIAQGQCGDDAFWEIAENGTEKTFTVYGSGDMWARTEWQGDSFDAWDITKIVIEDGVSSIGRSAFSDFGDSVQNPELTSSYGGCDPDTAKTKAFKNAGGVLNIPESVKIIDDGAFENCQSLTGVEFNEGLTEIHMLAFQDCTGLTGDLVFPDSVKYIDDYAFAGCTGINGSIVFGEGLILIGPQAFYNCFNVTGKLEFPENFEDFDFDTFHGTAAYTNGSPVFYGNVEDSNIYKFYENYIDFDLIKIVEGEPVKPEGSDEWKQPYYIYCNDYMHHGVYDESTLLTTVYSPFDYVDMEAITVDPDSVTIGYGLTKQITATAQPTNTTEKDLYFVSSDPSIATVSETGLVTGITVGETTITVSNNSGSTVVSVPVTVVSTIAEGQCGDDVFWKLSYDGTFTVYPGNDPDKNKDMWPRTEWEGDVFDAYTVTSIVLEEGITSVGEYAFGRKNIGTTQQPDSSKYGGSFQFGVNNYYTKPFENATGSIVIPESVKKIERGAFSYCIGLTGSLTLPDRLEIIENSAFSNSGITGDIVIPDSVTSIGDFAFQDCTGIKGTLTLSNNLEYLGTLAFGHCTYMTGTVVIPDSLTEIKSSAFYYAQFITGLQLGKNVVSIGNHAFDQCERMKGVLVIPDSVESIGDCAFMNCYKLEGVKFGNSVKSIGQWAFAQCTSMTGTLELPDSLESLGQDVFHLTARYQVGHSAIVFNAELARCNVYNFFEHYRNPDDKYQFIRVVEGEHVEPTETKDGRQTYYIYCNDPSHTSDVLLMTVNEPIKRPITYVTEIFVSPAEMTMEIGMSQQITASVGPEDASNKAITYISNDRNIATVDRNGVVKAIAAGTTTITVSSSDGTEISKTVTVTVLPQHVCTPGEPVHQDDFRDDENGYYSFDLVTYCTEDGKRIKTEMVDLERVEEKQPTETKDGNIEYFTVKSRSDGSSGQILLYDYTVYTFDNDTQTYVECNLGNIIGDDLDGYVFYHYSVDEERYVELDIQSLIDECDADDSKYYIAGDGYFSVYREELITDPNDPIYDMIFIWDAEKEAYVQYDGDVVLHNRERYEQKNIHHDDAGIPDSFDLVVLCTNDEYEFDRIAVTLEKHEKVESDVNNEGNIEYYEGSDGKNYIWDDNAGKYVETDNITLPKITVELVAGYPATETEHGQKDHFKDEDGNLYLLNGDKYVPATEADLVFHYIVEMRINEVAAGCTTDGSYDIVKHCTCTDCNQNDEFVKRVSITALGHRDADKDGCCDECYQEIGFRCSKCDWYDENKNKPGGFAVIAKIIHVIVHFIESINRLS